MSGSKITTLPGCTTSPEVLLHKILEQADHIENIAVVVRYKEDSPFAGITDTFHSAMSFERMTWMRAYFDHDTNIWKPE